MHQVPSILVLMSGVSPTFSQLIALEDMWQHQPCREHTLMSIARLHHNHKLDHVYLALEDGISQLVTFSFVHMHHL